MCTAQEKWSIREVALLTGVVAATLLVRLALLDRVLIVSRDAIGFVEMAQAFGVGEIGKMLAHAQHPFYPFLVGVTHFGIGDWIDAGRTVSILMGVLAVVPLYLLTREAFSSWVATVAGVLFAFLPSAASQCADILTEPTYVAMCLWGLYCAYLSASRASVAAGALLGLFAGLAYLTRPEGGGIFIVGAGAIFLSALVQRRKDLRRRVISLVLCTVVLLVTVLPYLFVIRAQTGRWHLTKKKKLSEFFNSQRLKEETLRETEHNIIDTDANPSAAVVLKLTLRRLAATSYEIIRECGSACHPLLLALAIVGVIRARRRRPWEALLGATALFYLALVFLVARFTGYASARHFQLVAVVLLPFAARAIAELATMATIRSEDPARAEHRRDIAWRVILAVVLLVISFDTLKLRGENAAGYAVAGRQLKDDFGPDRKFAYFGDARAAFYARGHAEDFTYKGVESVAALAHAVREGGFDFLVVDLSQIGDAVKGADEDALAQYFRPVLRVSKRWRADDGKLVIYRSAGRPRSRSSTPGVET